MSEPSKNQLLTAALITFLVVLFVAFVILWSPSMISSLASPETPADDLVSFKICPIHEPEPVALPLSEFGVCRARKDGRNLYCKDCIRKKVTDARRALKEYRAARRQASFKFLRVAVTTNTSAIEKEPPPIDRVRAAIRRGARTQKQIRAEAKVLTDDLGELLAHLLLWTREIRSQLIDNQRHYFMNQNSEFRIQNSEFALPARLPDAIADGSRQTAVGRKWRVG